MKGVADQILFDNETFDVVVSLISVYEHALLRQRHASFEINRVLKVKVYRQDKYQIYISLLELYVNLLFQSYLPKPLAEGNVKKF